MVVSCVVVRLVLNSATSSMAPPVGTLNRVPAPVPLLQRRQVKLFVNSPVPVDTTVPSTTIADDSVAMLYMIAR